MDAGIYTDVRRAAEGDSFLQLVTKKTRKVKRASPKQENAAQEVRRHFVQRVTKIQMLICAALSIRRML